MAEKRGAPCAGKIRQHPHGPKFLGLFLIWRLKQKPMYGYSLIDEIQDSAMVPVKASTLYMILGKLEEKGLVRVRVEQAEKRMRKIYSTTPKGDAVFKKVKKTKIKGLFREFLKALVA
ncbi:Transcriptional regulator PadR-like family protein [Candidatus Gugararchaeum adminiculabundum]|nr:Transcriptional regulator PadR-like family protein [Candidatus Gugararchaeum adminiculabundum]